MQLRPPDFAIVGAPKCGTTALYTYLAGHPGVAMSARKEPFFWCPDIRRDKQVTDRAEYDALWNGAAPGTLRGEASSEYLKSSRAIPDMLAARPDIRLIAMLRNPVEMVASLHSTMLLGVQEDERDFETAWRLQDRRRLGERRPAKSTEPESLQYLRNAAIGDQLERFLDRVPPKQRLVVVYDDFRADTRAEYLRVLAFLGLADDGRTGFAPVHVNRQARLGGLKRVYLALPRTMGPLYRPAQRLVRTLGIRPFALIDRATTRRVRRQPLRPEFEAELVADFLPQIEKVERLLGRDLSGWKGLPRPSSGGERVAQT